MRSRRAVLRAFAAGGVAAAATSPVRSAPDVAASGDMIAACGNDADPRSLQREFTDPILELIRLLNKIADIEHATFLQYCYAAFALKPRYDVLGDLDVSGATTTFLGMAIDRMTHFSTANRLLAVLGAPPRLVLPSFPFNTGVLSLPLQPRTAQPHDAGSVSLPGSAGRVVRCGSRRRG